MTHTNRVKLPDAIARCSAEFGRPLPTSIRLWLGFVRPLTVSNDDGSIEIYLTTGASDLKLRYQMAHEAFHAVCGPRTLHWRHELLAVHFSLLQLRAENDHKNVAIQEADLRSQADLISTRDLLAWSGWPDYPDGIYGCVFVLGQQLVEATSWEDMKRLVSADASAWLAGLEPEARKRVGTILAG